MDLHIPVKANRKLEMVLAKINADEELFTLLQCANVVAIDRLGYNDHGPTHVKIVANIALKMLRMLVEAGQIPGIVKDHKLHNDDAEVVVVLASVLHDIGHIVHREEHEKYSIPLAFRFMDRLLDGVYPVRERTIIAADVLHAIICHDTLMKPLTLEAGIIRVADGLDMEKGRARIPFNAGEINIHSVSAMAIDKITIEAGDDKSKPIKVLIDMSNSAGIFQVDELLGEKLKDSGIENLVKVIVQVRPEGETRIIDKFEF